MRELILSLKSILLFFAYVVILVLLTELLHLSDTFMNVDKLFMVGIISMASWMLIELGIDLNNPNL